MKTEVINVEGMTCNHCKESVEGALTAVSGVSKAVVNLDADNVTVEYDENTVELPKLKEEIEDQGYDVK